ncbi:putative alpha/beta hydrolase [Streptomyces millisiae]|uniref:Predicted hydrolase N-terminal domain-containing protein n=1 Tax=Streptomyces millisiae TaxID=3075542 RepID=A0ABU2LUK8_9ACTN|nr:hypothetical protein [Streptomyces sp. DSM 44918]MDT0321276.1 hypothetical protein [Streptomyces sp. DSM 44918]
MSAITITNKEVVAAAGKDPWALREEFRSQTQLEAIETLATTFRNGAAEAERAGDTARHADETEQNAGDHGGQAIYADAERHVARTREELGADDLDGISRVLRQVHGMAEDVLEAHTTAIEGGGGLDAAVDQQEAQANRDYASVVEQLSAPTPDRAGRRIMVYGESFPDAPGIEEQIRAHIERVRTGEAGRLATETFQAMDDQRDEYYGRLNRWQQDLKDLGYDVGDSPVNIWRTAGRAEHEGEELAKLLKTGDPSPEELAERTALLSDILLRRAGDGPEAFAGLKPSDREFARTFYDALGSEGLAAAGRLQGDQYREVQETLANGVNVAWSGDGQRPAALREFLDKGALDGVRDPEQMKQAVQRFNDFGSLMSHSTMSPNDQLATSMIDAAADRQRWWENTEAWVHTPRLDGAPELLAVADDNSGAAATAFGDQNRVADMMRLNWSDQGNAAGDLLRAASVPADGFRFTDSPEDLARVRAGYNTLQYVANHPEEFTEVPPGSGRNRAHEPVHAAVREAYADIAGHGEYLDRLANIAKEGPGGFPSDQSNVFVLTGDERHSLFRDLLGGDQQTQQEFQTDLLQHARDTARDTARATDENPGGPPEGGSLRERMRDLGHLQGAVTNAQLDLVYRDENRDDERADMLWKGWTMAVTAAGVAPGGWGAAAGVADALSVPFEPEPTAGENDDVRRYNERLHGDDAMLRAIHAGVGDVDYSGIPKDEAGSPFNPEGQRIEYALPRDVASEFNQGWVDELDRPPGWYSADVSERDEILDAYRRARQN